MSLQGQNKVRFIRIVDVDKSRLLGISAARLRVESQRDSALPTGRDSPIIVGYAKASARKDFLNAQLGFADIFHFEMVHVIPIFLDCAKIMYGFSDFYRGDFLGITRLMG